MRVYLDHNATTPLREEVLEGMLPFLRQHFGNPSSAHNFGKRVREAVEEARERVATAIGARPREIIFTSEGTEADNLALFGVTNSPLASKRRKVVTSAIEHPAVIESCKALKKRGFEVVFLPVTPEGVVDLEAAEEAIDENTLLVSLMLANNEIGTLQPVREVAEMAKAKGALVHTDAVQALGKVRVKVEELGVDLASFSSHKLYGPKGVGALYVRTGLRLDPLLHGGHQERRLRPGTENAPGIIGFGLAVELAQEDLDRGMDRRIKALRDRLQRLLLERIPHVVVNGGGPRVPNTLNMSFAFVEGEALTLSLDAEGVAVSTGSACSSGSLEPSHVLLALGLPPEVAHGSLRFSLGKDTTQEEVDYAAEAVASVVERLRAFSPLYEDFLRSGLDLEQYLSRRKEET